MSKWQEIHEFLHKNSVDTTNNVYQLGERSDQVLDFEETYLELRRKEKRVFSTSEAETLPEVDKNHPYATEWKMRKFMAERYRKYLVNYLRRYHEGKEFILLDLGCGNGWFIRYLSDIPKLRIVGVDINQHELHQAGSLDTNDTSLYILGNVLEKPILPPNSVDMVVMNSSLQYFETINQVIASLQPVVSDKAEIHILDTMIYNHNDVKAAEERSKTYYQRQQSSSMIQSYHHHTFDDFSTYQTEIMYDPISLINRIRRKIQVTPQLYWLKLEL